MTTKSLIKDVLIYTAMGVILIFTIFPIYRMIVTSLNYPKDALRIPPKWWIEPTLAAYKIAIEVIKGPFLNSFIISLSVTALSLAIGSSAAYGLSRFRIPGGKAIAFWILSIRMTPPIALIIPFFLIMKALGLIDTYRGLIMVQLTLALPLSVWIMRGFLMDVPVELEEAAMVDGCSRFNTLIRIVLPLAAPGLVVTAGFCFIFSWTEFMFAVILTRTQAVTLPVAISLFNTERDILWGAMTSSATLSFIPTFAFFFLIRKHLARGLTLGAVKY